MACSQLFDVYENRRSLGDDFVDLTDLAKKADGSMYEMKLVSSSCSMKIEQSMGRDASVRVRSF